jgi:hypothetical protein
MALKLISLAEWARAERQRLDAFAAEWEARHSESPDAWPMEMPAGDWGEQFGLFGEDEEEPDGRG